MLLRLNTHCPQVTHALPVLEIKGIFLAFSGQGMPDLPIKSFNSVLPIAKL
jgi:hypothetical protein